MLTEILVVGLLIYLALQDALIGLWSTLAAVISLLGMKLWNKLRVYNSSLPLGTLSHSYNFYIDRCIYSHLLFFKCNGMESKLRDTNRCLRDQSCSCELHHRVLHKGFVHREFFGANSWHGFNCCQNMSTSLYSIEYLFSVAFLSPIF